MRLVDADSLFRYMNKRVTDLFHEYGTYDHYATGFDDALMYIMDAPTIDAVPVVHAKWNRVDEDWRHQMAGNKCSACGFVLFGPVGSYCPRCGAKMDGGADNE